VDGASGVNSRLAHRHEDLIKAAYAGDGWTFAKRFLALAAANALLKTQSVAGDVLLKADQSGLFLRFLASKHHGLPLSLVRVTYASRDPTRNLTWRNGIDPAVSKIVTIVAVWC
jgi:hypothetical protein